jgi:hypothetical protein
LPDNLRKGVDIEWPLQRSSRPRRIVPPPELRIQVAADFFRGSFKALARSLPGELALLAQHAQRENAEERAREQDEKGEDSDESLARAPEGARPGWTAKRRIRHSVTHRLE